LQCHRSEVKKTTEIGRNAERKREKYRKKKRERERKDGFCTYVCM
jgi:hypothetical protein